MFVTFVPMGSLRYTVSMFKYFPTLSHLVFPCNGGFRTLDSGPKLLFFYGIAANILIYTSFQFFRFFQISIYKSSIGELVTDLLWLWAYLIAAYIYCHFVFLRDDISTLLNMLLMFERGFAGKKTMNRNGQMLNCFLL